MDGDRFVPLCHSGLQKVSREHSTFGQRAGTWMNERAGRNHSQLMRHSGPALNSGRADAPVPLPPAPCTALAFALKSVASEAARRPPPHVLLPAACPGDPCLHLALWDGLSSLCRPGSISMAMPRERSPQTRAHHTAHPTGGLVQTGSGGGASRGFQQFSPALKGNNCNTFWHKRLYLKFPVEDWRWGKNKQKIYEFRKN